MKQNKTPYSSRYPLFAVGGIWFKFCGTCEQTLPIHSFGKNKNYKDGFNITCRPCCSHQSPEEHAQFVAERERDAILLAQGMKWCRVCATAKPLDEFAKRPDSKDGRQYKCRSCGAIQDADYRTRHPGRHAAYRRAHPEIGRDAERRRRAQKANPDGRVENVKRHVVADRDGWECQLCFTAIDPAEPYLLPDGHPNPAYLNLDHRIPLSRGGDHTYDNVQATHAGCNWHKNRRTESELGADFAERMRR